MGGGSPIDEETARLLASGDVNSQWAKPGPYNTQLPANQEAAFRKWLADKHVPFDPAQPTQDYDMRGFYQGLLGGDPVAQTAIDPNDKRLHFPDKWKTPNHRTFSAESKYALPNAPTWQGDQLIGPNGVTMWDDTAPQYYQPPTPIQQGLLAPARPRR